MSIQEKAESTREQVSQFLRDMVKLPGISCKEEQKANRIVEEMKKLDFDEAYTDDYGNVIGRVGSGPIRIVFDAHIDTVDVGNLDSWPYHPFDGKVENGYIYGRGASDNHNGTAPQVYGAAIFKQLGKHLDEVTIFVVGSVQEEDCDGLGLRYALEESIKNVDYICLGESTSLDIYRGHRGRMEISVSAVGVSCHGSAPERGDNAIYKMMRLVKEIEELNEKLVDDAFLGKGTCAVTHVSCETPSLCAVPDLCSIHIDRRLTNGEDKELAVQQIKDLPSYDDHAMKVSILNYDEPSYKNKVLTTEKYYPTWVLEEDHLLVQAGVEAATLANGYKPKIDKWVFSTNGVSSMGQLNIPTIGYGPGDEVDAHTTNDRLKIDDLVKAVAFYAKLPSSILEKK